MKHTGERAGRAFHMVGATHMIKGIGVSNNLPRNDMPVTMVKRQVQTGDEVRK